MPKLPVIGRLSLADWRRIIFTWFMLVLNSIVELALMVLPQSLTRHTEHGFAMMMHQLGLTSQHNDQEQISKLQNIEEICAYFDYDCQPHMARTRDGFHLIMHRISKCQPEQPTSREAIQKKRPPVLMWHGFMMNSEVWVCHPTHSLAFDLVDKGYDVWLGNVRGNKYSCKHESLSARDTKYWDFGLDEHALIDLPCTVDYILQETQ